VSSEPGAGQLDHLRIGVMTRDGAVFAPSPTGRVYEISEMTGCIRRNPH
jgi:hypothetical protein